MPVNFAGVKYPAEVPAFATDPNVTTPSLFSLKGKVSSITGASQGIGYAVAEAFAQAGSDLALWYIGKQNDPSEKAEFLSSKYGVKVKCYDGDVTNVENVKSIIERQVEDFGKIDVFVANAGIAWTSGSLVDNDDDSAWQKVMSVNVDGVYNCAKYIGRQFKKQGSGSLIFTASISAHIVNQPQKQACYNASKACVLHLMKCLAVEYAPFARVNSVSPGYILTDIIHFAPEDMLNNWWSQVPLGRGGTPKELTGAYLYLASDASSFTTGTDIKVAGGISLA